MGFKCSSPGRGHILWTRASVEKDLAVARVEFMQDDELGGRLENLLSFRESPGPRVIGGHAKCVGIDIPCILGTVLDNSAAHG